MGRPVVALLASVLLLVSNHLLWAAFDGHPPAWDRAVHLEHALRCAGHLRDGAWGALLTVSRYYPPLTYCAAGLLHVVFGSSPLAALAAIQAALALLLVATYRIGVRLGLPTAGLAAAMLVGVYTELFLESRHFMLDIPLAALVALGVLALLESEGFARTAWALAAGALGGLGLLAKWTYPLFVGPVLLLVWLQHRGAPDRARRRRRLLAAAALALGVALPWYGTHLGVGLSLLRTAYVAGATEGEPPVTSPAAWGYYVLGLPYQLGPPFAALFAVGLWWARRRLGFGVLWTWLLVPLVVFTLLRNKDYRYTIPLLPAVALVSVAWLEDVGPRRRAGLLGALAVAALLHAAYLGWGWPAPERAHTRADRQLLFPAFPPAAVHWPVNEILDVVAREWPSGERVTVAVVPDHIAFSRDTFHYYAIRRGLRARVARPWTGAPGFIDYVVTKTGDQGAPHTTRGASELMARIEAGDPRLVLLLDPAGTWPLPDGSRATLHRVAPRAVQDLPAPAFVDRLRRLEPGALGWALRDARGLRLVVEPFDEATTLRGRLRRLVVSADEALVGNFRERPRALRVRVLEAALEDVRIDPHALVERGELTLLGARRLVIRRATVAEGDLRGALAPELQWVRDLGVSSAGGRLWLTGKIRGIPIDVAVTPRLVPVGLALAAERVRLGPLALPPGLVNALALANPVVRLDRLPIAIEVGGLALEDGVVRLGVP